MRLAPLALATTMLFSAAAMAAPSTALKDAKAGSYKLDKSHAFIIFSVKHMGFSNYYGRINDFDATLDFDPAAVENSKITVTIDPASIDTNHEHLEEELDSAQFFDTKKYPQAKFVSTKVEKTSDTTGKITGDLTLHGITKPVTLDVTFNGHGYNERAKADILGFSGHGSIKRSDFGVTYGVPQVSDEVPLIIEAEFQRKPD